MTGDSVATPASALEMAAQKGYEAAIEAMRAQGDDVASMPFGPDDRAILLSLTRAAIAAYLRAEGRLYPHKLPVTRFRHPGFVLLELANKAEGLEDECAEIELDPRPDGPDGTPRGQDHA